MNRFESLSGRRQNLILAAIVVAVILFLLVVAEAGVRVRQYVKYGYIWGVQQTYIENENVTKRTPKPNSKTGPIHINSLGFRSPEIPNLKPDGVIRLAFVGASTTYCAEVSSNENTWPHLVVAKLRAAFPDASFDYVNAAVPGYRVKASNKRFMSEVRPLNPDIVVVYHGTNDITGNTLALARDAGLIKGGANQEFSWISKYSLLANLVEKNLAIRRARLQAEQGARKLDDVDVDAVAEPFHSDMRDLQENISSTGAQVAIATFSTRLRAEQNAAERIAAAESALYYMPYLKITTLIELYSAYNSVLRAIGQRSDAILIEGENRIPADSIHFNDSVHFTDAGSELMSLRVAEALIASPGFRALMDSRRSAP